MVENRNKALLIIDVQNYFFTPQAKTYLPSCAAVLAKINSLVIMANSLGMLVIVTTHQAPTAADNLMSRKWRYLPSGRQCDVYEGLKLPPTVIRLPKEHYSAFHETELQSILKSWNVNHLLVCGVMTDLCVDTTVRHAFMLGFVVTLVEDACCSKDERYHAAALLVLRRGFCKLVKTSQILEQFSETL